MTPSDACLSLIKQCEGFRAKAYLCPAGVWTVGYGSTHGVRAGDAVTEARADAMLREDVRQFARAVTEAATVELTQHEFDALVSLVYNIGADAFRKSTLLRKLNAGDRNGAAEQFDRWTRGGGRVLPGLVKRRAAERALFEGKA